MNHDHAELEDRLHHFDHALRAVESVADAMIPLMHKPGWTTLAELAFVESMLSAMSGHVAIVGQMREQLIAAAKLVGVDQIRTADQNPMFSPVPPDHTRF